eukprot:9495359-Pyramimonas_sp.AAC.1
MVQKLDAQGNLQYSVFNADSDRSLEAIEAAPRMARLNNRQPREKQMSTGQEGATQEDDTRPTVDAEQTARNTHCRTGTMGGASRQTPA